MPFLPYSPRWLAGRGRDEEALQVLRKLRGLDTTDERVIREWVEIRSEVAYCNEVSIVRHPNCQDGSYTSRAMLHVWSYLDCFRKGCWKRTHVGMGLMFFQREYSAYCRGTTTFPSFSCTETNTYSLHRIRRCQCSHLLFTQSIRRNGSKLLDATPHVRRHQHLPDGCLFLVTMGNG